MTHKLYVSTQRIAMGKLTPCGLRTFDEIKNTGGWAGRWNKVTCLKCLQAGGMIGLAYKLKKSQEVLPIN